MANYVVIEDSRKKEDEVLNIADITGGNFSNNKSAFYGRVGYEQKKDYYLVCFSGVILASNPRKTWSGLADIKVEAWLDVEMKFVERSNQCQE